MSTSDFTSFQEFLSLQEAELRRIVFRSQGYWSAGDIPGEAWIAALDLQDKLGRPLNLQTCGDADLLLRKLRSAAYKAGEILRGAWRPDQAAHDEEGNLERGWDRYASDEGADALAWLEASETPQPPEPAPIDPYHSESAAWNWLWHRFGQSTRNIAAFLLISTSWCRQRRKRALKHLDSQQQLPHHMRFFVDETAIQPWRKFKLPSRIKPDTKQPALDFCCTPAQPEV